MSDLSPCLAADSRIGHSLLTGLVLDGQLGVQVLTRYPADSVVARARRRYKNYLKQVFFLRFLCSAAQLASRREDLHRLGNSAV